MDNTSLKDQIAHILIESNIEEGSNSFQFALGKLHQLFGVQSSLKSSLPQEGNYKIVVATDEELTQMKDHLCSMGIPSDTDDLDTLSAECLAILQKYERKYEPKVIDKTDYSIAGLVSSYTTRTPKTVGSLTIRTLKNAADTILAKSVKLAVGANSKNVANTVYVFIHSKAPLITSIALNQLKLIPEEESLSSLCTNSFGKDILNITCQLANSDYAHMNIYIRFVDTIPEDEDFTDLHQFDKYMFL